jgi:hypothetical protein
MIKIDLSALYENVGIPEHYAFNILEAILKAWGLKEATDGRQPSSYRLLMNASPDAGNTFFDDEFEGEYRSVEGKVESGELDEDDFVDRYAAERGGVAVRLLDGYEWAYAIVWPPE